MWKITRSGISATVAALTVVLSMDAAPAAENDVKALQEALNLINQEQQAVYQQFQMIQQLRRANAEPMLPPVGGGVPGNYDDVVAAKKGQAEREEAYARELQELYRRHRDLERERQPIMESLRRLRQEAPRGSGG